MPAYLTASVGFTVDHADIKEFTKSILKFWASNGQKFKEWAKAADYCLANEDFLFAYELAQSDQDPLRYLITERYRSKADYLGAHRSSSAFKVTRRPRAACASARAPLPCPRAPCHAC